MNKRIRMKKELQFQRTMLAVMEGVCGENGPIGDKGAGIIVREAKRHGIPLKMLRSSVKKIMRAGLVVLPGSTSCEIWLCGGNPTYFADSPFPDDKWEDFRLFITPRRSGRNGWQDMYRMVRRLARQFGGLCLCFFDDPSEPSPLPA